MPRAKVERGVGRVGAAWTSAVADATPVAEEVAHSVMRGPPSALGTP